MVFSAKFIHFTFNNLTSNEVGAFVKLISLEAQEGSTFLLKSIRSRDLMSRHGHGSGNFRRFKFSWTGKIDKWGNPASGTSDTQTYS
jgi:hypothetical protein